MLFVFVGQAWSCGCLTVFVFPSPICCDWFISDEEDKGKGVFIRTIW